MTDACDVLVVGGGPAGSVAALRLARLGFKVHLVEAQEAPRPHIGESITIGVHRLLAHLGLEHVLDCAERRDFETSEERWRTSTSITRRAPPGAATIDRALFDAAFLDQCQTEGVKVTLGKQVRNLRRVGEDSGWQADVDDAPSFHASFVVDASGRRGLLPRSRAATGARTIALFAYWNGAGLPAAPRVYAGETGWAWGAQVGNLGYNVTLFGDREVIRRSGRGIQSHYRQCVGDIGLFDNAVAATHSRIVACDATAWLDQACIGDDFVKIGEAAHCLDPLGSVGVQNAIQTAIWASIVVNTMLRRPSSRELAMRFYRHRLSFCASAHAAAVAEVYATCVFHSRPFWAQRGQDGQQPAEEPPIAARSQMPLPSSRVSLGPASLIPHACLQGDYVEERLAVIVDAKAEPVAFLGSLAVADIVSHAHRGCDFRGLACWMSGRLGDRPAEPLIAWLVQNEVVRAE